VIRTLSQPGQSLDVAQDAPLPAEFVLFRAGENPTSKGVFLFDAEAAKAVMAQYALEGVEHMIDLEHDSLDQGVRAHRADAADALGWYELAMRGGDLWAVNVRWNPEGERRLRNKTQRYISPAFTVEVLEGGIERVVSVANVALCARPATYDAPALVAASRKDLRSLKDRVTYYHMISRAKTKAEATRTKHGS